MKIQTDSLNANEYALNTDFYIWLSLFSVLLTFGMETTFFRFYNDDRFDNKDKLISTSLIAILLAITLFAAVIYTNFDFFLKYFEFKDDPLRVNLLLGILIFDTLAVIPFAYLRVINKPIRYTVIKVLNVAIIVVLNLVFLKYIPEAIAKGKQFSVLIMSIYSKNYLVDYIFIANLTGSTISLFLLIPYLLKFKYSFNFYLLKRMIKYSWPIVIAGIAYIINENLDKFLIKRLIGNSEMGIYSACYKLSIFMNLYIMAFRLGAEPYFFSESIRQNAKETYSKAMTFFVIVGTIVFLGIVVYIDLLKHFINSSYWAALSIVPIVLLANLFLGIYHNLSIWYKLTDKTYYGMYFSLFGAFLTIILNLLLLPRFGYIISAWVTLIVYFFMALLSYIHGQKYFKIKYDIYKLCLYLIISIVLSVISFAYLRTYYGLSTLIFAIYLSFILINERKTLFTLKK